jgi:putative ABC transport system permease protein
MPMMFSRLAAGFRGLCEHYSWRIQEHAAQEFMACIGIAVGVALFFGVIAADTSVTGSAPQLIHQIVGSARFVLNARSSEGFSERIADDAGKLRDVQVSSPLLKEQAVVVGRHSRESVQLIGVTPSIVGLESEATRNLGAGAQLLTGGIGLPEDLAREIGASAGRQVTLITEGVRHVVVVRDVLGSQTIGVVASSPVVVGLLSTVQQLTAKPSRVTQVLIRPRTGTDSLVADELKRLSRSSLTVVPATDELHLLQEAAKPSEESTKLFAFIGAMVGFLLALTAVLITAPERRRSTAEMRSLGYTRRYVVSILIFQATVLGIVGSLLGIALGYVLSKTLFHEVPGFLASAFLLSLHPSIRFITVLAALGCGLLAALGASVPILLDLRSEITDAVLREPGEAGQSMSKGTIYLSSAIGAAIIAIVTVLILLIPSFTIFGGVLLALAAVCLVPIAYIAVTALLTRVSEDLPGSTLPLASAELEATTTRSVALAAIIALAVYGSVAVGGAQHDLLSGLDDAIVQEWSTAPVWVTPDSNIFDADTFQPRIISSIADAPGVANVLTHQGGFLDLGQHRLWIRAEPPNNSVMILSSQLLQGDLTRATKQLRRRGWVTVSNGFASERHLHVGSRFTLPTPSGVTPFLVAAITTNIGWPSGTITMNTNDYRQYWKTSSPTTLAVRLKPGVSPTQGVRTVERALGPRNGLRVQTASSRIAEVESTVREGLRSLGEISMLLLIAAALAVAAALGTAIWQRRRYLASLKAESFDSLQLWRAILFECAILLIIGSLDGTVLGIYGHALANRWLKDTTGFPAPFGLAWAHIGATLALVVGIALFVISVPGLLAARVPARESFQE